MILMPSAFTLSTGTGGQFLVTEGSTFSHVERPSLPCRLLVNGVLALQLLGDDVDPPARDYRDRGLFNALAMQSMVASTRTSSLSSLGATIDFQTTSVRST